MADDELIIPIEKHYWPKGVIRGLAPILRSLGDKHGNLTIAAVPTKNHIMVKGPPAGIEGVKPELRAILEEHFPDAPVPPELGGTVEEHHEEHYEEPPAPEPEPPKQEPPKAAAAQSQVAKPSGQVAKAAEPAKPSGWRAMFSSSRAPASKAADAAAREPVKSVTGRKRPRTAASVPSALLWECTRNNSSFIRNPLRQCKVPFSAEPCNLLAMHSARFSGIASTEALDVRSSGAKGAKKESIELAQSHARTSRRYRPPRAVVTTGLSKCTKKGFRQLHTELSGRYYRKDLLDLAQFKYTKIQQTFKKKKVTVKSRRSKKSE